MIPFSAEHQAAANRLIDLALAEDLGERGDLTCAAVIPPNLRGSARFVARKDGVLAGLPVAALIYEREKAKGDDIIFLTLAEDGSRLSSGTALARISGPMNRILSTERTVLNFLQRLSGVASLTRRYVDLIADLPCRLLDTRKTTPGWRLLEKYAVSCGGGHNHRMGLHDGIMLKDNHLAALAHETGTSRIVEAVKMVRQKYANEVPLEVEVDTLEQLEEALSSGPDVVLLDNMSLEQLRQAVLRRNAVAPGVLLEASGGVTFATLRGIAETGVDRISVGALTHSATALDIGLDYQDA